MQVFEHLIFVEFALYLDIKNKIVLKMHSYFIWNLYSNKSITCKNTGLIYLAECFYVEYSIGNLPKRFSYHKSYIKLNFKYCRLTNHFLDKAHDLVRDKNQKKIIFLLF